MTENGGSEDGLEGSENFRFIRVEGTGTDFEDSKNKLIHESGSSGVDEIEEIELMRKFGF